MRKTVNVLAMNSNVVESSQNVFSMIGYGNLKTLFELNI